MTRNEPSKAPRKPLTLTLRLDRGRPRRRPPPPLQIKGVGTTPTPPPEEGGSRSPGGGPRDRPREPRGPGARGWCKTPAPGPPGGVPRGLPGPPEGSRTRSGGPGGPQRPKRGSGRPRTPVPGGGFTSTPRAGAPRYPGRGPGRPGRALRGPKVPPGPRGPKKGQKSPFLAPPGDTPQNPLLGYRGAPARGVDVKPPLAGLEKGLEMPKKGIFGQKGQFWPFWGKNPDFGVFGVFWAPWGTPGTRLRRGFYINPSRRGPAVPGAGSGDSAVQARGTLRRRGRGSPPEGGVAGAPLPGAWLSQT